MKIMIKHDKRRSFYLIISVNGTPAAVEHVSEEKDLQTDIDVHVGDRLTFRVFDSELRYREEPAKRCLGDLVGLVAWLLPQKGFCIFRFLDSNYGDRVETEIRVNDNYQMLHLQVAYPSPDYPFYDPVPSEGEVQRRLYIDSKEKLDRTFRTFVREQLETLLCLWILCQLCWLALFHGPITSTSPLLALEIAAVCMLLFVGRCLIQSLAQKRQLSSIIKKKEIIECLGEPPDGLLPAGDWRSETGIDIINDYDGNRKLWLLIRKPGEKNERVRLERMTRYRLDKATLPEGSELQLWRDKPEHEPISFMIMNWLFALCPDRICSSIRYRQDMGRKAIDLTTWMGEKGPLISCSKVMADSDCKELSNVRSLGKYYLELIGATAIYAGIITAVYLAMLRRGEEKANIELLSYAVVLFTFLRTAITGIVDYVRLKRE